MTAVGRGWRVCARVGLCLAAVGAAVLVASCGGKKVEPTEPRIPREIDLPTYLQDTVGELARIAGREAVTVQGFGFVTGLDGTGTRVVPPGIRQQVLNMMRRNKVEGAEEILASPETAVVTVTGQMGPGTGKGEVFDLDVRAIANTETTSLEGGFVLECDLTRVELARGVESRSEALALGRGGIFVSPFAPEGEAKATPDPRVGRILAGGKVLKTRHFRLALLSPSVRSADQIVRLVNARFPGAAKGSEDPGRIDLEVPKAYLDEKTHFLDLVGALYMRETPDARDRRIALLLDELKAGRDMDRVALCIEAFGSTVVPRLHTLAEDPSEAVRFYASRTLAWLQDAQAVHGLERIALDDGSRYQEQAVAALGTLRTGVGLGILGRVLDVKSARVRVAAWRAMADLAPRTFLARTFADKFTLDAVATRGDPFIYVARTLKPQIAVFGDVRIRPPVLAETSRVTATVQAGETEITLISRRGDRDRRVKASLDVKDLMRALATLLPRGEPKPGAEEGLGLGYSDVVGLLHVMSRKGALTGPIVLQPLEYRITGDRPVARPIRTVDEEP
ncbi:MAG: flagellar basal body P-ring protein FlgI [Planctomycetes bacterium]|nr:flagellar basal body P-ring protein FlgI [Planctomycetota bacterium]